MSNRLEELHLQYKRYYLKKYLKAGGIFLTVLVLGSGTYYLTKNLVEPNTLKKVSVSQLENPKNEANRPSYALDVSADELDAAVKNIKDRKQKLKISQASVKEVKVKPNTFTPVVTVDKSRVNLFSGTQEERSLQSWIEKYNQKKSYAVAIYIAKQYFFDKDFEKSGVWAKRANQLDRNKEEAWLYYAKSVYALGDTPKAKRILNIYLQYKKSVKAELLLSEWGQ